MKGNEKCFGNCKGSRTLVEGAGFCLEKALESSSGDVFLARSGEGKCSNLVVVKRFRGPREKCFEAKEQFLWQDHPNIGRILDVIPLEEDNSLIVSEFYGGRDLYSHFQEIGIFPEFLARILMHDLFSGVVQLHRAGICHRDLKPENCVLDANGVLKIIDFGIAARFDEGTVFHDYCGSVEYTAPELLLRQSYCGPAVDKWACGVVLFEMVVGEVPFSIAEGESPSCGVFDFPVGLIADAELSVDCVGLLKNLLCLDPEKRLKLSSALDSAWMIENDILTVDDVVFVRDRSPKSVILKRLQTILRRQVSYDMHESEY